MAAWISLATDLLWHSALAVIPLALVVGVFCRWVPCRPATRHTLWLCVLATLVVGLVTPPMSFPSTLAPAATKPTLQMVHPTTTVARSSRPYIHRRDGGATHGAATDVSECTFNTTAQSRLVNRNPTVEIELDHWFPTAERPPYSATERRWNKAQGEAQRALGYQTAEAAAPNGGDGRTSYCRTNDDTPTPPTTVARTESVVPILLTSVNDSVGSLSNHEQDAAGGIVGMQDEAAVEESYVASVSPSEPLLSAYDPTTEVSTPSALSEHIGRWVGALVAVRDAFGRLPTIPPMVWGGGILLVLAVHVRQALRFGRLLRGGAPAPGSVTRLVAEAANTIGLRNVPEAVMVQARISPMVWCGRRTCLVLPRILWSELDETGRRAVVLHELAHIHRRDHWICWIESVISAIYWWDPFVWWVRGRLREEAENCCDAWVTWLQPRDRRIYAEALLKTKQFVSESSPVGPGIGINVFRGRAKLFARRLTMVMTESKKPSSSVVGIVLAIALVTAGWMATPARSSEPGEKNVLESDALVLESEDGEGVVTLSAPMIEVSGESLVALPAPALASIPSLVLAAGDDGDRKGRSGTRDLEKRIERLERQLDKLSKQLDRMTAGDEMRSPKMPKMPPMPPMPPAGFSHHSDGETIVRTYEIPEGRLEALTKLMIRPDVPTRVRPVDGGIEVHGSWADHVRFKAFADIITMKKETKTGYHLPEGKLKALTELMARSDVPVMVSSEEDAIVVHGGPAVQAVFRAFVDMIHPPKGAHTGGDTRTRTSLGGSVGRTFDASRAEFDAQRQTREPARQAMLEAVKLHDGKTGEILATRYSAVLEKALAELPAVQAITSELRAETSELQRELEALVRATVDLAAKAKQIEAKANHLEDKADDLRDQADELRRRASEISHQRKAAQLGEKADGLEEEAEALEEEAEELLEELEDMQRDVQEQAEEFGERIEEFIGEYIEG